MFELSMSLSWDYLWVMDDDVYPEPDCLTNLLKYIGKMQGSVSHQEVTADMRMKW